MKKREFILADSGGSSTKWAIVKDGETVELISTSSLHPKFLSENTELETELKQLIPDKKLPLYFYGAGCGNQMNQERVEAVLKQVGFSTIKIFPDTLAVCRALLSDEPGWIGIFGTGSIIVYYNGQQICERIGGLGSILGDEGSGFYFGKLLLKHALTCETWSADYVQLFQSKAEIYNTLASQKAIQWISQLAEKAQNLNLESIHTANILAFIKENREQLSKIKTLSLNGSYAYQHQILFQEAFKQHGISIKQFEKDPINGLISYHLKKINIEN
jgi:N-acetylglucosamine kinase-like BadF-type ATPase